MEPPTIYWNSFLVVHTSVPCGKGALGMDWRHTPMAFVSESLDDAEVFVHALEIIFCFASDAGDARHIWGCRRYQPMRVPLPCLDA